MEHVERLHEIMGRHRQALTDCERIAERIFRALTADEYKTQQVLLLDAIQRAKAANQDFTQLLRDHVQVLLAFKAGPNGAA